MTRPIALAALAVSLCAAAATIFLTTIERSRLLERAPRALAALDPILPPAPSLRLELVGGSFEIHDADGAVASIPVLQDQGMFGSRAVLIDAPEGQRLVVAAPMAHDAGAYAGSLWWFDHDAILPAPDATDPVVIDPALASRILDGPAPEAFLGAGLAATQDLNADGVGDLLVGAPGEGAAFVLSGADGSILRTLEGDRAEAFGIATALATDFPRDGVREHAVASMFLDPAGNTRARRWTFDGATGALLAVDATADAPIIRLAGDLDGNGAVTDADLARVLLNFGLIAPSGEATPLIEDINQDSVVDEQDVDAVLNNFGETAEDFGGDVALGVWHFPCDEVVYFLSHPGQCVSGIPTTDAADGDLDGGGVGGPGGGGGDGGGSSTEDGTTTGGGTGGSCSALHGPGPGPYSIVDRGAFYVFRTNRSVEDCFPDWNVSSGAPAYYDNTITAIINAFDQIGVQTVSSGCNCSASYYVYEARLELDAPSFPNPAPGEPPSHILLVNDDDDDGDGKIDLDDVDLASDDDFAQLTIGPIYGGGGGGPFVTGSVRWTLTGEGVRLWYRVDTAPFDFHANAESPGTPVVRTIGGATYREFPDAVITRGLGVNTTILVEAVAPSATVGAARIRYALTGKAAYGPMNPDLIYDYAIENEVRVTAINLDLDIDSDNTGAFAAPSRSANEDLVEDTTGMKVVVVNRDDADGDDIPDYADGFGLFGAESVGGTPGRPFIPLHLDLGAAVLAPGATLELTYDAAPPDAVSRVYTEIPELIAGDPPAPLGFHTYDRGAGLLRLWRRDAGAPRSPDDFVASDQSIELATLGPDLVLYVEAVNGSPSATSIKATLKIPDLADRSDTVRVLPFDSMTGLYESEIAGFTIHYGSTQGTPGNDIVFGSAGADTISTGGGDDIVVAGDGDDVVGTGEGADVVFVGDGDMSITLIDTASSPGDGLAIRQVLREPLLSDLAKDRPYILAIDFYERVHGAHDPWMEVFLELGGEIRFVDGTWYGPASWWDWVSDENGERPIIKIKTKIGEPFRVVDQIRTQLFSIAADSRAFKDPEGVPRKFRDLLSQEIIDRIVFNEFGSDVQITDYQTFQQAAFENAAGESAALAGAYLEGIRILSTPTDLIVSVGEIVDGKTTVLVAGLAILPFVTAHMVDAGRKVVVRADDGGELFKLGDSVPANMDPRALRAKDSGQFDVGLIPQDTFRDAAIFEGRSVLNGTKTSVLVGTPQVTSGNHATIVEWLGRHRFADDAAEYTVLNRRLNTTTGRLDIANGQGTKLPDVAVVRRDGRVDLYEVQSGTQDLGVLAQKLRDMRAALPPPLNEGEIFLYNKDGIPIDIGEGVLGPVVPVP